MTLHSSKWVCYVCATGRRADCELSTGETQSPAPASFIFNVFVRQMQRMFLSGWESRLDWDDVTLSLSRNAPMHDNAIASASIVCVEQSVWSRLSWRWAVMSCAIIVTVWSSLRSSADWITATKWLLVDFRMLQLYTSRPHWWRSTRGVCTRGRGAKLPLFWTKGNFTTVGATFKFSSSGLSGNSPSKCLSVCQTQRSTTFWSRCLRTPLLPLSWRITHQFAWPLVTPKIWT